MSNETNVESADIKKVKLLEEENEKLKQAIVEVRIHRTF